MFKQGIPFLHNDGGTTYRNTALGLNALTSATLGTPYSSYSGAGNTAIGFKAVRHATSGSYNTGVGSSALSANTSGSWNTASGAYALYLNTTGHSNTAVGLSAMLNNESGIRNVAVGDDALRGNYTGGGNTALGSRALYTTTGSSNTAIGVNAGSYWTTGSDNIAIGSGAYGEAGESGTIRIGGGSYYPFQTRTFVQGIRGATSDDPTNGFDESVCTDQFNQLGPCTPSTARLKTGIEAMADLSDKIVALHPVTFRYKGTDGDPTASRQHYGLVAEDVAKIFPTLVSRDDEGKPFTVRYELLTPLLLNEIQREKTRSRERDRELDDLRQQVADLRKVVAHLKRRDEPQPD